MGDCLRLTGAHQPVVVEQLLEVREAVDVGDGKPRLGLGRFRARR
jgi:hypothetical protein